MSRVYEICDGYVDAIATLDPITATDIGLHGHEDELPDLSPVGHEATAELARATLRALDGVDPAAIDDRDRIAGGLLRDRLQWALDRHDIGEHFRDVRTLGSELSSVRYVFDLMPFENDDDWDNARRRMLAVPTAVDGWITTQREGIRRGLVSARRQAAVVARQAATWAGIEGETPFFRSLADGYSGEDDALRNGLAEAADTASDAFAHAAQFLRDEYTPVASERDGVGAERYEIEARGHVGARLDLDETYAWAWDDLAQIERDIADVCERIVPGGTFAEAVAFLESDPARVIDGEAALVAWLQDLIDSSIESLDGTHFHIAPQLRACVAKIAPPGGAAAAYYSPPSEDWSRPGHTWYPTQGRTQFPTWREVSICFHEAVPGHHLQLGQLRVLGDSLSRYQRLLGWVSGHGEGWALYAERLMAELGFHEDPGSHLGMLASQAIRAVRVIVDIGMHLEMSIPAGESFHPGERWTPALALEFVLERARFPEAFLRSEVDRYLGLPGQAISYKVGERVWMQARDDTRRRHGASFDLRAWHTAALDLGAVTLDVLASELARF